MTLIGHDEAGNAMDALAVAGAAMGGGAMGAVPENALAANTLRGGRRVPETAAQQVARLLREGRAAEVTDDLRARVDPQEMTALYESGATGLPMPMDEASRMARAREMGFLTELPMYHGTNRDIQGFDPGVRGRVTNNLGAQAAFWTAETPETAEEFAELASRSDLLARLHGRPSADSAGTGHQVLPLLHRASHPVRAQIDEETTNADVGATLAHHFARGVDGVRWENSTTPRGATGQNIYAIRDADQLRSPFAVFDPRLRHLANLSAAGAGAAYLTPASSNALRPYGDGP